MAADLPPEIQSDVILYSKNEELRALRGELILLNSKIESGSFSGKSLIENLLNNLNDAIDFLLKQIEIIVIPEERRIDFAAGDATLDEYGSFEILRYYNELQRIKWMYFGLRVIIQQISETDTTSISQSLSQSQNVLNQLNEDEFLVQGAMNPVYDKEVNYKYYTIVQGDTLPTIASKNYNGDASQWPKISSANNLTDSALLDNNLVGTIIRIPIITQVNSQAINDNLVYEIQFSGASQSAIDQFLYGQDIFLQNKKMQVSSSNDIKRVKGSACVVQNIQSRFLNTKGSLNPLHPNWGLESFDKNTNIPFVISLDRLLTDMEYQAMADPRVISATILRDRLKLFGDAFTVEMEIQLLGNDDTKIITVQAPKPA